MTGLKVGRLGLGADLQSPSAVTQRGNELTIQGWLRGDSIADVEELVQQALGLTGDDRYKPLIAGHNSRLNGAVEVLDVEIGDVLGASPPNGALYSVTLTLRRFPTGFAAPWCQSILDGKLRTNVHSIASGSTTPWHAVPSTVEAYTAFGSGHDAPATRAGDGGTANIYVPGSQAYYDARPAYFVPLTSWYSMAPTVRVGGRPVVGAQTIHSPDDWEINNQLLRIRPGTNRLLDVAVWGGAAWETVGVELGRWTAAPFASGAWAELTDIVTARVVRTGVASSEIVLSVAGAISSQPLVVQLSISLRRGARIARCLIEASRADRWGLRPDTTYTATTGTAGVVHETSNNSDGNRLAFFSSAAISGQTTTGTTVATSQVSSLDLGIGVEVGGTGSADPDRVVDLLAQYFAGMNETVEVVAL